MARGTNTRDDPRFVPLRELIGGLDSASPPHRVDPRKSPDLLNVQFGGGSVSKRGGFVPLVKQHPKANSVKNAGWHSRTRASNSASTDADVLIVPGCLYAGHRQVYTDIRNEYAVDFMVRIDDLTSQHVGNGEAAGAITGYSGSPYTIKVRPILSKGPVKKTLSKSQAAPITGISAQSRWLLKVGGGNFTMWAPDNAAYRGATDSGMPFFVYLWNNGTGAAPVWQLRFSFHAYNNGSGAVDLITLTSTAPIRTGVTYHIIGSVNFNLGTSRFRVGYFTDEYTPATYSQVTQSLAGYSATMGTPTPIQVFDCPQNIIEAPAAADPATRRQAGLGLGAFVAASGEDSFPDTDGGYFFACKRFEGAIEDLIIWGEDPQEWGASILDRAHKFDLQNRPKDTLLGIPFKVATFWSFHEKGEHFVQEVTGVGNHLYFVPNGPVFDGVSGSPSLKGSWWFNGTTSYAKPVLEDFRGSGGTQRDDHWLWRVWVRNAANVDGILQRILEQEAGHGLQFEFWPDSIEPNFEQVLGEIQGAMRLSITETGRLAVYTYNAAAGYQNRVEGSQLIQPGHRYNVSVFRRGTTVRIYVNGALDVSAVVAAGALSQGVGCFTIGMGAKDFSYNRAPNYACVDHRAGFIGRIEKLKILVGDDVDPVTNKTIYAQYKDELREEMQYKQGGQWTVPANPATGSRTAITRARSNQELASALGSGALFGATPGRSPSEEARYAVLSTSAFTWTIGPAYDVAEGVIDGDGGVYQMEKVGSRPWWTMLSWVLDKDDEDDSYSGQYYRNFLEVRGAGAASDGDMHRSVHTQGSVVTDQIMGFALEKRCIESDWTNEETTASGNYYLRVNVHQGVPYDFRSPRELCPLWGEGLVQAATGTNPITMIASYDHQASGERLMLCAAARQVYWVKPIWRNGSPFSSESQQTTRHAWSHGAVGDHIRTPHNTDSEITAWGANNYIDWSCFVRPDRLEGTSLLAMKGDPALSPARANYMVWLENGCINVAGTMGGGTRMWRWFQGRLNGTTEIPECKVRAGDWNHIKVRIGGNPQTVQAWVNGQLVTMTANVTSYDAIGAAAPDAGSYDLFLFGLPRAYQGSPVVFQTTAPAGNPSFTLLSLRGMLSEVASINERQDFDDNVSNPVPWQRKSATAGRGYLMRLSDGAGWSAANLNFDSGSPSARPNSRIEFRELIRVAEGLAESKDAPYRYAVYNDFLYLTNGESKPQEIRFLGFSMASPFRCAPMGMRQPFRPQRTMLNNLRTNAAADRKFPAGQHHVWITFLDEDDRESEPTHLHTFSQVADLYAVHLLNIPRSHEPHVKRRLIYCSVAGGGNPVASQRILDNETGDVEVHLPTNANAQALITGLRLIPPKAKLISVGPGALFLGNLPQVLSGRGAFAWSGLEPTYWTADQVAAIPSQDGRSLTSMQTHRGKLNLFKRDSTWALNYRGIGIPNEAGAFLDVVNKTIGLAGGSAVYDNVVFGSSDRGVYSFNGGGVTYVSPDLDGEWANVDHSDDAYLKQFGAFFYPDGQYWLSLRRVGQLWNDTIYVLHTDPEEAGAWSKLVVPEHSYMEVLFDPFSQNNGKPILVIGTTSGALLYYDQDKSRDYHSGSVVDTGTPILGGTASVVTVTSLTNNVVGLDAIGNGLHGMEVKITGNNGTWIRKVQRNDAQTMYWIEPLPVTPTGTVTWELGGYLGYWTSGWLAPQEMGSFLRLKEIDLEFEPSQSASLDVKWACAIGPVHTHRPWPPAGSVGSSAQDLTSGVQEQPIPTNEASVGRYFRAYIGTDGADKPFRVTGMGLRFDEAGFRGQPR